jgi:hypothetical protein
MKYTKTSLHAFLAFLHPGLETSSRSIDATTITSHSASGRHYDDYSLVFHGGPELEADVGILISNANTKRRLEEFTCPATCTNEALCDCAFDYANASNAQGQETCASIIATSCKNPDEIASCSPNPYYLAWGIYYYCPLFQCLDVLGIGMNNNNTKAYFECLCEAQSNMCEECKKLEGSVKFCKDFMSTHEELCSEVIRCCATETSMEGLTTCHEIWCDCSDDSTSTSTSLTEPVKNKTDSGTMHESSGHTSSANKEEASNVVSSFGQWFDWKQMTIIAVSLILLL